MSIFRKSIIGMEQFRIRSHRDYIESRARNLVTIKPKVDMHRKLIRDRMEEVRIIKEQDNA